MPLKLNRPAEKNKEFYGRNVKQMPLLIAEGRVPMSVAGLMDRRLQDSDLPDWMNNYFDTGDAIAYGTDGEVKVVLDSQTLRQMNPESELQNGALVLTQQAYDGLNGSKIQTFTRKDLKKLVEKDLTPAEAKKHPVWQFLARDQGRLDAYVDKIFEEAKKQFSYDTNMGIYLDGAGESPKLRAGIAYRLYGGSRIYGRGSLGDDNGRLVGIAPEAPNAQGIVIPTLEQAVAIVNSNRGQLDLSLKLK